MSIQRNLLFGTLAAQLDFISADQFVAGMSDWVRDKSQNLGDILLLQGALNQSSRDILETLVEKHLALHGNQPALSLAAMPMVDAMRQSLLQVADHELRTVLAQLTVATVDGDNLMRTLSVEPREPAGTLLLSTDETPAAPRGGEVSPARRFRILRPHAKGGLGEVFVAEDQELHREVALKEIQLRHAKRADSRSRFLLEAEVTGSLEHPGIVPVYALGHYPDGRPYYAMRFIRGESLHDAIDRFYDPHHAQADAAERALGLRQLLRRFIDVCNAIDYAHSRAVLHRDLKPANVMLGKYGETLVVDWGLAKMLGRASTGIDEFAADLERALHPISSGTRTGTQMGVAIGTPAYMSPEQAAGRLDELGPAADVYSLGATLYTIVTGEPPFTDADVHLVINRVKQGKFPPPRVVNPACPKPLEAICLRAMALAPADRYANARELADDVEHWLADEATEAYQEPWRERLLRWARKHKSWTQAIAASLIVVAVVATAASMLINQSRHQEALARVDAEDNFQAARRTVDDFFTRVSENKLLNVPGLQPLRKDLLQAALGYYNGFIAQRKNDPKLQRELADTYYRVGLISGELGNHQQAGGALRAAYDLQTRLVEQAGPDLDERQFALSNTLNALGDLSLKRGNVDDALSWFRQALGNREQLVERQPTNVAWARKLANSDNNVGIALARLNDMAAAEKQFGQANRRRALLVVQWPKQPQLMRDLALGYFNIARFKQQQGDYDAAAANYQQAIETYQKLVALDDKPIEYQRELATSLRVAGDLVEHLGQNAAAAQHYQQALDLAGRLARQNPFLLELQADVASIEVSLGRLEQKTAHPQRAAELFAAARTIRQQLTAADPDIERYQLDLAQCQSLIGELQLDRDQLDLAAQSFATALEMYNALAKRQSADPTVADAQAQTLRNAALVARARGDHAAALDTFGQGRAIYERLAAEQAQDLAVQMGLADALVNEVVELRALGQLEQAAATADRALHLQQQVAAQYPDVALYQYVYTEALYTVGLVALEQDQPAAAAEKFTAAADVVRKLADAHPENLKYAFMLGSALDKLSICQWKQDQRQVAQLTADEAATWAKRAFEALPTAIDYRLSLNDSLFNRAVFAREQGELERAARLAQERQAIWPRDALRLYSVGVELAQLVALARGAQRDEFASQAIAALHAALDVDATHLPNIADDRQLEVLRTYLAFQTLGKSQNRGR